MGGPDSVVHRRLPGGGGTRWGPRGMREWGVGGWACRPSCPISRAGAGRGRGGAHSRPLQELLLLLPVRVHQLLRHQLHQLQALLHLHQDLEVLPAPHLSTDGDPRHRCLRGRGGLSQSPLACCGPGSPCSPGAGLQPGERPPWPPPRPRGSAHSGCRAGTHHRGSWENPGPIVESASHHRRTVPAELVLL